MDTSYLVNLVHLRREMKGTEKTGDPDHVMSVIAGVSSGLENACAEEFEPIRETRIVYPSPVSVSLDKTTLKLIDPATRRTMRLAELESVTSGTRELDIQTEVALEFAPEPSRRLFLMKNNLTWSKFCQGNCWSGNGWATCSGARVRYAVAVTGWWVYRDRYTTQGWRAIDKLNGELSAIADNLSVVGGVKLASYDGIPPRIAPGTLFRIGDEVMRAMKTDNSKRVTSLLRGLKGTEPDIHNDQDTIYVWSVQPELVEAAQRWATLAISRQGVFETSVITDVGVVRFPSDIPTDVRAKLWRWIK